MQRAAVHRQASAQATTRHLERALVGDARGMNSPGLLSLSAYAWGHPQRALPVWVRAIITYRALKQEMGPRPVEPAFEPPVQTWSYPHALKIGDDKEHNTVEILDVAAGAIGDMGDVPTPIAPPWCTTKYTGRVYPGVFHECILEYSRSLDRAR